MSDNPIFKPHPFWIGDDADSFSGSCPTCGQEYLAGLLRGSQAEASRLAAERDKFETAWKDECSRIDKERSGSRAEAKRLAAEVSRLSDENEKRMACDYWADRYKIVDKELADYKAILKQPAFSTINKLVRQRDDALKELATLRAAAKGPPWD